MDRLWGLCGLRRRQASAGTIFCGGEGSGFTLLEVLVAMTVLTVSLLGLALLFPMVIRLNAQSLMASRCLQVSQQELEQLRQNVFSPSGSFTDPEGNMLDVGCWGLPGTSCGNPLTPEGDIDFSLPPAVGYSVEWRDSAGQLYSVRWNITVTAGEGRKIVLATEAVSPPSGLPGRNQLETIMVR